MNQELVNLFNIAQPQQLNDSISARQQPSDSINTQQKRQGTKQMATVGLEEFKFTFLDDMNDLSDNLLFWLRMVKAEKIDETDQLSVLLLSVNKSKHLQIFNSKLKDEDTTVAKIMCWAEPISNQKNHLNYH